MVDRQQLLLLDPPGEDLKAGVFAAPGQSDHPHTANQNSSRRPWGFPQFSISQILYLTTQSWVDLGGRKPALMLLKDANLTLSLARLKRTQGFPIGVPDS